MSYQTPIQQLWSWNTIFGKQSYEEFLLSTQKPKERELIPFFQEEELEPILLEEQVVSEKSITPLPPPNWIKKMPIRLLKHLVAKSYPSLRKELFPRKCLIELLWASKRKV